MHTHILYRPPKDLKIGHGCVTQALVNRTVANMMRTLVLFPLSVTSTYYHVKSKLVSWEHMVLSVASSIWNIIWRTASSSPQTTQADTQRNFPVEPTQNTSPQNWDLIANTLMNVVWEFFVFLQKLNNPSKKIHNFTYKTFHSLSLRTVRKKTDTVTMIIFWGENHHKWTSTDNYQIDFMHSYILESFYL